MVNSIANGFRWAAMVACILIFVLTTLEVLLRLAGLKFSLSYEYCGFLLGALVFFMLPAVTIDDDHISVIKAEAGAKRLVARLRHGSIVLVTLVYIGGLIYLCGITTLKSYQDGIKTQGVMLTPLYIPQLSMIIGLSVTVVLVMVAMAVRARRKAKTGGDFA
ncbi:MAG: TRAP transporter small permease subunit [Alphaproteobacteria bacterium]